MRRKAKIDGKENRALPWGNERLLNSVEGLGADRDGEFVVLSFI